MIKLGNSEVQNIRVGANSFNTSSIIISNFRTYPYGSTKYLRVSQISYVVSAAGGWNNFNIESNTDWTVSQQVNWIHSLSPTSGSDDANVRFSVYPNEDAKNERTGTLTVRGTDVEDIIITVNQAAAAKNLYLDPTGQTVSYNGSVPADPFFAYYNGYTSAITFNSSSWITANWDDVWRTYGDYYERRRMRFSVENNDTLLPRTGYIRITDGNLYKDYSIKQRARIALSKIVVQYFNGEWVDFPSYTNGYYDYIVPSDAFVMRILVYCEYVDNYAPETLTMWPAINSSHGYYWGGNMGGNGLRFDNIRQTAADVIYYRADNTELMSNTEDNITKNEVFAVNNFFDQCQIKTGSPFSPSTNMKYVGLNTQLPDGGIMAVRSYVNGIWDGTYRTPDPNDNSTVHIWQSI